MSVMSNTCFPFYWELYHENIFTFAALVIIFGKTIVKCQFETYSKLLSEYLIFPIINQNI